MFVQIFCFGYVFNYRTTFYIECEARKRLFPELILVNTGGIVTVKKQKSMKKQAAATATKSKNSASTVDKAKPCFNAPDDLMQEFISFHEKLRNREYPLEQGELAELGISICSILLTEAFEPGTELAASPWRKDNLKVLQKQNYADYPEASGCICWIKCLENKVEAGLSEDILKLTKLPLWEPVQRLVYCALAWLGEHRALNDFISPEGELNDLDMTLLVLGEYSSSDETGILERLPAVKAESKEDEDISGYFQKLLNAEVAIAASAAPDSYIEDLECLSNMTGEFPCDNYNDLKKTRIGIRAEAALLRLQLGDTACSDIVISDKLDKFLPFWEKHYYRGLILWKQQKTVQAIEELDMAYQNNPKHSSLKYAYATMLAEISPEKALDILKGGKSTYEMILLEAMILVRLRRYEEAHSLMADCNASENARLPLRFRWFSAMRELNKQEFIIKTALAELKKDWNTASQNWRKAFLGNSNDKLYLARQLYLSTRMLESIPADSRREKARLERDIKRIDYLLHDQSLDANELFFKTAAELRCKSPSNSNNLNLLRCNRSWFEKEKKAGGERLQFIASELFKINNLYDAISTLERIDTSNPKVKKILAVMSIYSGIVDKSDDHILEMILHTLSEANSGFPLFNILAAIGLLASGNRDEVENYIKKAEKEPDCEKICSLLRFLEKSNAGNKEPLQKLLNDLDMPEDVRLAFKAYSGADALDSYLERHGTEWVQLYPMKPEHAVRQSITKGLQDNDFAMVDEVILKLKKFKQELPKDLAAVVCLRKVLDYLLKKELVIAEKLLTSLEGNI